MLVSVTPLGARPGRDVGGAVAATVEYLEGRRQLTREPDRSAGIGPGSDGESTGAVGYYADSSDQPGAWTGRGVAGMQLRGPVGRDQLARLLLGQDPRTGRQLVNRAAPTATSRGPAASASGEWLALKEAATHARVGAGYLRRLARTSEAAFARRAVEVMAGAPLTRPPNRWLAAERSGPNGGWRVSSTELARFAALRSHRSTVIAYDVTFSAPKSVSILWACGPATVRAEILAAIDASVAAGVGYLEQHAAFVRVKGQRLRADGLLAASYLHTTSRALDPQLHRHVIVGNFAAAADGNIRALYSSALFAHAKTAGYLAAAELRHQLTARLGVAWGPVIRGVADIEGIPRAAIRLLSTRSAEIAETTDAIGTATRQARQVAAYDTRSDKHAADPAIVTAEWHTKLASVGFDRKQAAACLARTQARPVTPAELDLLFVDLGSSSGVTEQTTTFDRRDVIQHVASWADNRLPAAQILELADAWLASGMVIRLSPSPPEHTPADRRLRDRWLTGGVRYTTPEMLAIEDWLTTTFDHGRHRGMGVVDPLIVDGVLAARPTMGSDQAEVVRAITGSGHLAQCVLGPAGTGKTFALEAAARAWETAGFDVLGAAVGGTAAEVLGTATGIRSTTLASLLTRLDTATTPVLTNRSVVVVDEASTIGNRDLARLLRHAQASGTAVRLVGDSAQHTAVNAGGAWRYLIDTYPDDAAALTTARRQAAPALTEVRRALDEYRRGHIAEAVARLDRDQRIIEADTPDALLDALVSDWYLDRSRAQETGGARSSMVAEHHTERRELNRRARSLLAGDGTLTGPTLTAAGIEFRVGDEVIARAQDRTLRPAGGDRTRFVRNGTRGTVIAVNDDALVVDFVGRGPITVPRSFLQREIRPGIDGGLVHSYCLTSHAAQGETYEAARHLGTDRSTRPGVYVGLTRGRNDVRLYVLRHQDLEPPIVDDALPRLAEMAPPLDALADQLAAHGVEQLAREIDPTAPAVTELRARVSLHELRVLADHDPTAARSLRLRDQEVAAAAILFPPPDLVDQFGHRPVGGPERRAWERAIGLTAIYRDRWGLQPPDGAHVTEDQRAAWYRTQIAAHDAVVARCAALPAATLVRERAITTDDSRQAIIDDAFAIQVGRAVRYPAAYLVDVLGHPPHDDGPERQRWDDLARRVERYRHRTLGLNPIDGPAANPSRNPTIAAIGLRPAEPAQVALWSRLHHDLARPPVVTRPL
jgi:conjugative relaxase-like TrwC/TraI family protein